MCENTSLAEVVTNGIRTLVQCIELPTETMTEQILQKNEDTRENIRVLLEILQNRY